MRRESKSKSSSAAVWSDFLSAPPHSTQWMQSVCLFITGQQAAGELVGKSLGILKRAARFGLEVP